MPTVVSAVAAAFATTIPGVLKVTDDVKVSEDVKVTVDAKVSDAVKVTDVVKGADDVKVTDVIKEVYAKSPAEPTKAVDATQITEAAIITGAAALVEAVTGSPNRDVIANAKAETLAFLEQEYTFSSSELASKTIKKERVSKCCCFYAKSSIFFKNLIF